MRPTLPRPAVTPVTHQMGLFESPSDAADLTSSGALAAALPLELRHSRMIAVAALLGLLPEAVVLAAALTLQRPPFRIASTLIYTNPTQYNELVAIGFEGRRRFDQGMCSEPLALLALYVDLQRLQPPKGGRGGAAKPRLPGAGGAMIRRLVSDGTGEDRGAGAGAGEGAGEGGPAQFISVKGEVARWCEQRGLAPKQVRVLRLPRVTDVTDVTDAIARGFDEALPIWRP